MLLERPERFPQECIPGLAGRRAALAGGLPQLAGPADEHHDA